MIGSRPKSIIRRLWRYTGLLRKAECGLRSSRGQPQSACCVRTNPDSASVGIPEVIHVPNFAADAVALAENLIPDRYVVMGHSFACSIALELARVAANRVIGAVLVDPVVTIGTTTATPVALPSESFASMEEAQGHFRDTEEGS